VRGLSIALRQNSSKRQIIPKGTKMIANIATTILLPLCVVTIVF